MKKNNSPTIIAVLIVSGFIIHLLFFGCAVKPYNINENKPKIYGLTFNMNGSGGHQIVDVNHDTGQESKPRSLGIPTSAFGIARKYVQAAGQNQGIVTGNTPNLSICGSGTQFYAVDLTKGTSVKLGVAQGYSYIEDIEFNPIDNKLYGIYNDALIRVDDLGTCAAGSNGSPAQITNLGKIGNIGSGPYSVYFDHLGTCYIVSAKEHLRAIVEIPLTPNANLNLKTIGPILSDASWSVPTTMNNIGVASCVSGTTQIIGVLYGNATPYPIKSFFHFGNPSWTKKGNYCVLDYTSTAKVIGPK